MTETQAQSALPLQGVRVVDFGHYLAGPAVGMMLADLGAEVTAIHAPGSGHEADPTQAILGRNKTHITLDLKSATGLAIADGMICEADVLIENFRPGVMDRLGLGVERTRQLNPRLIRLSLPGFASTDAERRHLRAFEPVIGAASGMYSDMGLNRVLMGINPSWSPLPLASAYATVLGAAGVTMALFAREATGSGEEVEVPLASALMEGLAYNSITVEDLPERYKTQREIEIERLRFSGLEMQMSWEEVQDVLDPFFRPYRTGDGRMIYLVCPSHHGHARRALELLGLEDRIEELGLVDNINTYLPQRLWHAPGCLGFYPLPEEQAQALIPLMQEQFLTRSATDWERLFGEHRIPGGKIRTLGEWIGHEQATMSGLFSFQQDPALGETILPMPGPLVWTEGSAAETLPPKPRRFAKPMHKPTQPVAETGDVSCDLPPLLEGVKVLDLSNVIAAPHAGGFLARFGAEVVKIDPAEPEFDPRNTVIYGLSSGRGKRSLLLDLRSEDGQRVFEDLARDADVIIMNAPPRQVPLLGLDAERLQRIAPKAVLCLYDCFGGPRPVDEGLAQAIGYDDIVQAVTGIMARFGGGLDTPEEHAHVGTIDVMCGFAGVVALSAALYKRERTGKTDRARTSLLALSALAQINRLVPAVDLDAEDDDSGDPQSPGPCFHWRFYQAADGWIFLALPKAELGKLDQIAAFDGWRDSEEPELVLAQAIWMESADHWQGVLTNANIGIAQENSIHQIMTRTVQDGEASPGALPDDSFGFTRIADHPSGHAVTQFDPCAVRLSRSRQVDTTPMEKHGASSRSILSELGYDQARIDELEAAGVISTSWSEMYLPD